MQRNVTFHLGTLAVKWLEPAVPFAPTKKHSNSNQNFLEKQVNEHA